MVAVAAPALPATSEPLLQRFGTLLTYFPPHRMPLRQAPEALWWKLALWDQINQRLASLEDPDLPPYQPSPEQWAVHLTEHPLVMIGGGEGGGKTRTPCQEAVARILGKQTTTARYWLVGVDYEASRPEFTTLMALLQAAGALPDDEAALKAQVRAPSTPNLAWSMRLTGEWDGVEIITRSVKDFTKIRSWALDGAIVCEAALVPKRAFERMVGRIRRDKWREGWMLASGTFERTESPWFARVAREWQREGAAGEFYSLPSWSNRYLYPGGRTDPRILEFERTFSEDYFQERYAGVPVKPSGLVFKQYDERVHPDRRAEFRPWLPCDSEGQRDRWPVELAMDPSFANYAILAIQRVQDADGRELVHVIDEVWGRGQTAAELIDICRRRVWWPNINPQNAGVMDVAGKQHHGTESTMHVWSRLARLRLRSRHVPLMSGIDRLATFLRDPERFAARDAAGAPVWPDPKAHSRVFIHPRCRHLLDEFGRYQWRQDSDLQVRDVPEDKFNHGIKALTYWIVDRYGFVNGRRRRGIPFRMRAA